MYRISQINLFANVADCDETPKLPDTLLRIVVISRKRKRLISARCTEVFYAYMQVYRYYNRVHSIICRIMNTKINYTVR